MGPSGRCILAFRRTFRWLPSSAERRRHVQARPLQDLARIFDGFESAAKPDCLQGSRLKIDSDSLDATPSFL
jgi:hypothetical protein